MFSSITGSEVYYPSPSSSDRNRFTDARSQNSIGNAKISGMETDLSLTSSQYSIALVVFFIGYVVFEVPSKYVAVSPVFILQFPFTNISSSTGN